MPFQVIPVIDLLNGRAVHAVGGRRAYYQPLQSILHASSEPIPLARAISRSLRSQSLYLADLDAIAGRAPHVHIYREIIDLGVHLWIDAGIRDVTSLAPLLSLEPASTTIIVGLETVSGPRELTQIVELIGMERVIFSLDLFDGRPRCAAPTAWSTEDPRELAEAAIACGVRHLLILDLARVGTGRGLGSRDVLKSIRESHPSILMSVGGGIARIEEVDDLRSAGAGAVLVGTAIHDGRIGASEIEWLATASGRGSID
jgi:phosphoribosylformimino-5-aminoimidazole carboxamide ribotide isomerase